MRSRHHMPGTQISKPNSKTHTPRKTHSSQNQASSEKHSYKEMDAIETSGHRFLQCSNHTRSPKSMKEGRGPPKKNPLLLPNKNSPKFSKNAPKHFSRFSRNSPNMKKTRRTKWCQGNGLPSTSSGQSGSSTSSSGANWSWARWRQGAPTQAPPLELQPLLVWGEEGRHLHM